MKITSSFLRTLLSCILLCIGGAFAAQAANSTIITFSVDMTTNYVTGGFTPGTDTVDAIGSFDGWSGGLSLSQDTSKLPEIIYTNTVNDTADANGTDVQYKFQLDGSYENTIQGDNRAAYLPATSGASLVLPTPFYSDNGGAVTNYVTFQVDMSQQINLGQFTNSSSTLSVNGNFNGWTGGADPLVWTPSILETNQYGLVSSNVWTGTFPLAFSPNCTMAYKFVENNNYEVNPTLNDSGNRFFISTPPALTLPVVFFDNAPYAPLAQVTFSVDMSAQLYYSNWIPSDGVFCQGINGDWNNDAVNTMTNNPGAANTNIYYATYTLGQGSVNQYKFTYNGTGGTVYEDPTSTGGNNRSYTVPLQSTDAVPTVYFSDLAIDDLLVTNVYVTFSVDMTNAVQDSSGPNPGQAFDPSSDQVYVNGSWIGWVGWLPEDLYPTYELNQVGTSEIYTNTFLVPQGSSIPLTYKYSIDASDDEAPSGDNHVRIIRTSATGSYVFPLDVFANQYNEPSFGQLSAIKGTAGTVQLSWLGAPNVEVQTSTNLTGNSWTNHPETAGTVWSAGTMGTNGLISVTNWPTVGGNQYFRLVQH